MAVRALVQVDTGWDNDAGQLYKWTGLLQTSSDSGAPLRIPAHSDITVQMLGTLGTGGVITMEGTLDNAAAPADAQYGGLNIPAGTALTLTAIAQVKQVLEHPLQIRPRVTAGNGTTNLECWVIVTKQWRK